MSSPQMMTMFGFAPGCAYAVPAPAMRPGVDKIARPAFELRLIDRNFGVVDLGRPRPGIAARCRRLERRGQHHRKRHVDHSRRGCKGAALSPCLENDLQPSDTRSSLAAKT